jgi:UDPglucose--hexose-1-phosphate uridylyltransferase
MTTDTFHFGTHVHRRFNPLSGEWVLVCPHRNQRPWQGHLDAIAPPAAMQFDPQCYLCPGNARAGGAKNPAYAGTFVFDNDFAAMSPNTPAGRYEDGPLIQAQSESGICRVICFSPRHDLGLGQMVSAQVRAVVDTWAAQTVELGSDPAINSVQIFENRGAMMGASNPHPHGQIWASASVPPILAAELAAQRRHIEAHGRCLLCTYLEQEIRLAQRLVLSNEEFLVLVPFWATWPFETMVLPRAHGGSLAALNGPARDALAEILRRMAALYDRVFQCPFPYTAGWHQQPTDGRAHESFHLHAHFYPPLLRSASVRKFMVGFEMLAGAQRDMTAETAAAMLRSVA